MSGRTARARWLPGAELPPRDFWPQLAVGGGEAVPFQLDWLEDFYRIPAREPDRRPRDLVTD